MKKISLIFIVSSLFVLASCKKQYNYLTETETAEILLNKNIDSISFGSEKIFRIIQGSKTVFKYDHTWNNSQPGIADGYSGRTYAFEIVLPSTQTSFLLSDNEIKNAYGFYSTSVGFGSSSELITKGKITGSKINNTTWNVVVHFELSNATIDMAKNFTIK